ncbi:NAD(P)H-binding protein [Nonomuraea sp. 3-1Str]|uniref:NAD(P)H-binding protein n=1 Tax=Nonomuraea sp. 3-1Str TaxID=2929801 RepID=UPI002858DC8B|nr:NAD(P)H-binding protein [Nonomuraea sp. 3-1Str]MDR8413116.1 NAD(P)H-binding protein [Nonomuraea sp. 3-1Str]
MILITGATGTIGRLITERLSAEGVPVRAVSRSPEHAGLPAEVEIVRGDPARPDTMAAHFDGVEAVFLHPRTFGDTADRLLALAAERGVSKVVALSAMNIDDPFDLQPSRWRGDRNKEAEEAAVASGLAWTSLRAGSFAGNTAQAWGAQIRAGDVVRYVYATFRESLIDERDLAEVAVRALLTDELVGRRLELTGPQSLSHEEMVGVIASALGRPLRFEEIPAQVAARRLAGNGFPEPWAGALMARYAHYLGRDQNPVTGDVDRALGRPARTYAEWVAHHLSAFRNG